MILTFLHLGFLSLSLSLYLFLSLPLAVSRRRQKTTYTPGARRRRRQTGERTRSLSFSVFVFFFFFSSSLLSSSHPFSCRSVMGEDFYSLSLALTETDFLLLLFPHPSFLLYFDSFYKPVNRSMVLKSLTVLGIIRLASFLPSFSFFLSFLHSFFPSFSFFRSVSSVLSCCLSFVFFFFVVVDSQSVRVGYVEL